MSNLTTDHFFQAAKYIDRHGIPPKRGVRDWAVPINNREYPVKYVLSVARSLSKDSNGICSGSGFITNEAVAILKQFGFKPVEVKKRKIK